MATRATIVWLSQAVLIPILALAAAMLLLLAVAPAGRAVAAPSSDMAFAVDQPDGESNRMLALVVRDPGMTAATGPDREGISVVVFGPPTDNIWLRSPAGEDLSVGTYEFDDIVHMGSEPEFPHASITPGCISRAAGSFQIREIEWSGTELTRLAVDITCHAEGFPTTFGQVRFHSTVPIDAATTSVDQLTFARTLAGTVAPAKPITVTNAGDVPLTLGRATPVLTDAADFRVVSDGCHGRTLAPGGTCLVSVAFAPIDGPDFDREARLDIPDTTVIGVRQVELVGSIRRPTTITLTGPATSYYPGGIGWIKVSTTPQFLPGTPNILVDGVVERVRWEGDLGFTFGALGPHAYQASWPGNELYAPSNSNVLHQLMERMPQVTWNVYPSATVPGDFYIDASVTGGGSDPATGWGGILSVADATTGEGFFGVQEAVDGAATAVVGTRNYVGHHVMRAVYRSPEPYVRSVVSTFEIDGRPGPQPGLRAQRPPVVKPPTAAMIRGSVVSVGGSAPMIVRWTGTPGSQPIAWYDVERRIDGGPWTRVATWSTPSSLRTIIPSGHATTYRVRAMDMLGRTSLWSTSAVMTPKAVGESSSAITYRGSWSRATSSLYVGGAVRASHGVGASASLAFTGRSVAWITTTGPARGIARVYVDGISAGTVDLRATATSTRSLSFIRNFTASGRHTIRIVVVSGRVDIDGFIVVP